MFIIDFFFCLFRNFRKIMYYFFCDWFYIFVFVIIVVIKYIIGIYKGGFMLILKIVY